ncbi:MAG: hypothetical protein HY841_11800 [Bacteroidetes bacterium]|nr:hypothetical protein [Bacteroidota bacterium]
MIYRFRITYEDHEDVFRDIEIKSSQSFMELHTAIQQAIAFDNSKQATFHMSDDYWRREEEIISINTSGEEKKRRDKKEEPPSKKIISDHVNHPHQKFIYVFDPEKEWTFTVELLKIIPDEKKEYPLCVKSAGTSPKQYKATNLPPPPVEDDDDAILNLKDEKEIIVEPGEEKISDDDEVEGLLPLDDKEVDTGEEKEEGAEEEEEEGESSEGFEEEDVE